MTTYLLDANVFIEGSKRYYGFDFCPAFWDWLDAANHAGTVFSIEKVSDELVGRGDDLTTWARQRGAMFLKPDDSVVDSLRLVSAWAAQSVASGRYKEAAMRTFLQEADYYLIAHARAQGHVVVTHEIPGTSAKEIKIPDACIGVGIKCMSPYDMLRIEQARFVLRTG